jgi:hypothetical protein
MSGPASMRRACVTALIALVVEFGLGMVLNLYVTVPASDHHTGLVNEIETAPPLLTIHVLLGVALICAAGVLLIRAIGERDRVMIAITATGLGAVLGAYAAGEVFVRDGRSSESLTMAILTGVALVAYIVLLARIGAATGQVTHLALLPATAPRPKPERALRPKPDYAPVPRPRPVNRLSGPQRRLGYSSPAPEPRPANAIAAAPRTRPTYPATGPETDPQLRAARQTGPQPRIRYGTDPQPRASHPYPPAAPYPQQRRPQTP